MKFFRVIRSNFASVGIDSNQPRLNASSTKILFVLGTGLGSCVVFLAVDADKFVEYIRNIYVTTSIAMVILIFTNFLFQKDKIFRLIDDDDIGKFYDQKSEDPVSEPISGQINQSIEKWCQFGRIVVVTLTPVCFVLPLLIISYSRYFVFAMQNESFELQFPMWFPFEWRNPIGYLFAATFEYEVAVATLMVIYPALFFSIGTFLYVVSATNSLKDDLKLINENATSKRCRLLAVKWLSKFIQNHSALKQIVRDFSVIYQLTITILSVWSFVTICSSMLLVQILAQAHDLILLLAMSTFVTYAFGLMLVACELGQRVADEFDEINDVVEAFDWNSHPPQIRKVLPTLLSVTQQPVEVVFYGRFSLSRETFKKIIKGSWSYFATVRRFLE